MSIWTSAEEKDAVFPVQVPNLSLPDADEVPESASVVCFPEKKSAFSSQNSIAYRECMTNSELTRYTDRWRRGAAVPWRAINGNGVDSRFIP